MIEYKELKQYLELEMKMSHIYQPVLIKALLLNDGVASKTKIAERILAYDQSQIEYYEQVVTNMVGRVLRKNGIVSKDNNHYTLNIQSNLNQEEIDNLVSICDERISDYQNSRGKNIWEHRRRNRKPVKGSIRYKVLKRAKGRCELCGVSKNERALEVDHILPKNLGGQDTIDNYQALCYKCNSNKGDRDDEDFRQLEKGYNNLERGCVFCEIENERILFDSALVLAFRDKYPVSEGHTLIIPKRHCKDYFELYQPEINAMHRLSKIIRLDLRSNDPSIDGFNIGFNAGQAAGQTIDHCHMHIIPRRRGDDLNPTGGIRKVIDGRGSYKNL